MAGTGASPWRGEKSLWRMRTSAFRGRGAAACLAAWLAAATGAWGAAMPAYGDRQAWPSLRHALDPWLQTRLQERLRRQGLDRAVTRGRLAVALVDITRRSRPRLAALRPHHMGYAASLPKIAIMLAVFQRDQDGELTIDDALRRQLNAMIRHSSNTAATALLERVGYHYLAALLQSDRYRLYDPQMNGGLWVGKAYARQPARRRDPLHNLSHGATPFAVARFYYLLDTERLVSARASREMKTILARPALDHKFVAGLKQRHPHARIMRKSGTWRSYHADGALVARNGRRYIAVALANSAVGDRWLRRLILVFDRLIFDPQNIARDGLPAGELRSIEMPAAK